MPVARERESKRERERVCAKDGVERTRGGEGGEARARPPPPPRPAWRAAAPHASPPTAGPNGFTTCVKPAKTKWRQTMLWS
jgi:hypothetical protein